MKKLLFILLSLLFIFSCSGKGKLNNKNKNGNTNTNIKIETKEQKLNEAKKYNVYIDSYNSLSSFDGIIDSYLRVAGDKEKLNTSKEISGHFNYTANFLDNLKEASTSKPKMEELDKAASALIPSLEELVGLLNEADDYYKAKDYLDDKYAEGQELHTKILAAIYKYDTAVVEYYAALSKKSNEVEMEDLNNAKKDGRMITYNKILTLQLAEDIMNEIDTQKLTAENVTTADLTKIKPLYEQFNMVQKQLRESVKDPELLKKEGSDEEDSSNTFKRREIEDFVDTSTEFKTSVIAFIDRVEKNEKIDAFKLEHKFPMYNEAGSPEQLNKLISEMVKDYNQSNR